MKKVPSGKEEKVGRSDAKKEKEARDLVRQMPVLITGIPESPVVLNRISKTIEGVRLLYDGPTIYPRKEFLNRIKAFPDVWAEFLQKLAAITFFAPMTTAARERWLYANAFDKETDLVDLAKGQGMVEIEQEGGLKQVLGEDTSRELAAEPVQMSTIKKAIQNATDGKRTLFFLPNYWTIDTASQFPPDFDGLQINLSSPSGLPEPYQENDSKNGRHYLVAEGLAVFVPEQKGGGGGGGSSSPIGNDAAMLQVMMEAWGSIDPPENKKNRLEEVEAVRGVVRGWLERMPSGFHKSLLQKIVRFQPLTVEAPTNDVRVRSEAALLCVMADLAAHPGHLSPTTGRFVTGCESLFKRLAVMLPEDSYVDDAADVVFLLSVAAVAKANRKWRPNREIVVRAFELALGALKDRRSIDYQTTKDPKAFTIGKAKTPWETASALLDAIGGMHGDLRMFRELARRAKASASFSSSASASASASSLAGPVAASARPAVMNFLRCVDQHCAASIAYFFPYDVVMHISTIPNSSAPFGPLLKRLFGEVTGVNPRRQSEATSVTAFGKEVALAQQRFWAATHRSSEPYASLIAPIVEPDEKEALLIERELPDAWIAAGIGIIHISSKPARMVTVHTERIEDMVVIRRPAREMKKVEPLTEEEKEEAIQEAKEKLREGILWRGCEPPIPEWTDAIIALRRFKRPRESDSAAVEQLGIKLAGQARFRPWARAKRIAVPVPLFEAKTGEANVEEKEKEPVERAVGWMRGLSSAGAQRDGGQIIANSIARSPPGVLRRLLTYIGNFQSELSLPRVARDGSGVLHPVSLDDVGAFQLLLEIARLFPAALQYKFKAGNVSPLDFAVRTAPLLWEIARRVRDRLAPPTPQTISSSASARSMPSPQTVSSSASALASASEMKGVPPGWPALADRKVVKGRRRRPWEHQIEIVADFWRRKNAGARGNLLLAPPGMGKTRCVTQFVAEQIAQGTMSDYLVYSLPGEAMLSVINEWLAYGATVRILDPHVSSKIRSNPALKKLLTPVGAGPVPFTVTMVMHDHLRDLRDVLSPSVMAQTLFVLDESHKALNDTQRTQVCLELSNSAKEFLCMTGTLLIDTKFEKIVPWIAQIVPIPVNNRNFWVALNSMIAKRVDTGIRVLREEAIAPLSAAELVRFKQLMPPWLGGSNRMANQDDRNRAIRITQDACTRGVVDQARLILNNPAEPGVMIVAETDSHAQTIKRMLLEESKSLSTGEVLVLGSDAQTIDMTAANADKKDAHPGVRAVIVPIRFSTGYNLSRFRVMISAVIPSNEATRSQIEGRINRIGQDAEEILYVVVLDATGFWKRVLESHQFPRNANDVINFAMGKQVHLQETQPRSAGVGPPMLPLHLPIMPRAKLSPPTPWPPHSPPLAPPIPWPPHSPALARPMMLPAAIVWR